MDDVINDALIVGAVVFVGYNLFKTGGLIPNGLGLPGNLSDIASNAATGKVTPNQTQIIAAQAAAGVAKAGGTPAQQAAAAQEVANDIAWNAPFGGWLFGIGSVPATTIVPGTGNTIYELRKLGYTDDQIDGLFRQVGAMVA